MSILLFLNADSLLAAFEWPWQQAAEQKEKNSGVTSSPPTVMAQAKGESRNAIQQIKQGAVELKMGSSIASSPVTTKQSESSSSVKLENAAVSAKKQGSNSKQNAVAIKVPKRRADYRKAVELQEKLSDLLKLSAGMDRLNRSKIVEVQNIVDKARINQDIFTKLASPIDAVNKIRKADAGQILLSKKIRAMREEAEKQMALAQSHKDSVLPGAHKTSRI